MTQLVWIGDGSEGALSEETRALLLCGLPIYRGVEDHPSYARLTGLGFAVHPHVRPFPEGALVVMPGDGPNTVAPLYQLVDVVRRLLGPGGCPWDQKQTHESLKKYLLEEAYEVLDAIDSGSSDKLREELGDLILQPMMHAAMAERDGKFDIDQVANEIVLKLVRRHPHVFADVDVADSDEVLRNWDAIKKQEKGEGPTSLLEGVPTGMASLLRAHEISKRAARAGFEWPSIEEVFEKLHEEERELQEAIASGDQAAIESEIGDLFFTCVNIARWADVEPEEALRKMLNRFSDRFKSMEMSATKPLTELGSEDWEELWNKAKRSLSG